GAREVPAREIGELVMHELKKLDKVAYIRFASVYKSFQDPDDFRDVLQDLEHVPPQGVDDLFK
ncbi:MAG: ATP cone domain-containing protein, partial [Pseudomonadota bacterium]